MADRAFMNIDRIDGMWIVTTENAIHSDLTDEQVTEFLRLKIDLTHLTELFHKDISNV